MSIFIADKREEIVPDGEYTAIVKSIKQTMNGENIIFRCELTSEGFEGTVIPGFCGAHWRPSTRTTANLRQWCINLGVDVQKGSESSIDLEKLVGSKCRVIVQEYTSKAGEQKCKVSNILPFQKKPRQANPVIEPKRGLYIGGDSSARPMQDNVNQEQATASAHSVQHAPVEQVSVNTTSSEDDIW